MNLKTLLERTKADVQKQLMDLPMVVKKEFESRKIFVYESGETKVLVRCAKCGTTFKTENAGTATCPSCGHSFNAGSLHILRRQQLMLPSSLADREGYAFGVLAVTDYDVRTEKVRLISFDCRVHAGSDLSAEDSARYAAQCDPRIWNYEQKSVDLWPERWFEADIHRMQTFAADSSDKIFEAEPATIRRRFCEGNWLPQILGNADTLETLRRHHYPVDDGPAELMLFLAERADGKKLVPSRAEKECRKQKREENKRMKEMAEKHAFSLETQTAIAKGQAPALFQYDFSGHGTLYWCPSHHTVCHLEDENAYLKKKELRAVCPVCGKSHKLLLDPFYPQFRLCSHDKVIGQLAADGTMLVHVLVWNWKALKQNEFVESASLYPEPKQMEYFVCTLGKHSFHIFKSEPADGSKLFELTPAAFRRRLFERGVSWSAGGSDGIAPGLDRILQRSNASWLPLTVISQDGLCNADAAIRQAIFCWNIDSRQFKLLDDLYKAPALAKLAEAGYPATLLDEHDKLVKWVKFDTTLAEMLDVEEDVLPHLPLPKSDRDERVRSHMSVLLSIFENSDPDDLRKLEEILTLNHLLWSQPHLLQALKGHDPKHLFNYILKTLPDFPYWESSLCIQYCEYLRDLKQMKIVADTENKLYPDDPRKAYDCVSALADRYDGWKANRGKADFPLMSDLTFLKPERFDDIEVFPCWNASEFVWDLMEVPGEITARDLNDFPFTPLLKAVQNGKTIGLAKVKMEKKEDSKEFAVSGFSVCFFEQDDRSRQPKTADVFRKYADTYSLCMEKSE